MAHHQGMSIVALANVLLDGAAQRWGMANAACRRRWRRCCTSARRARSRAARAAAGPAAAGAQRRAPGLLREVVPGSTALAADASAVQRPLQRGAARQRRRLEPLGHAGHHALARRRAARRARQLLLPALGPASRAPVSITQHPAPDPAAHYQSTLPRRPRVLRRGLARGAGPHHGLGQPRGRHRVPPGRAAQPERSHARPRADVGLRGHAGRRRAPTRRTRRSRTCSCAPTGRPAQQALVFERKPRLATEQGLHAAHFLADADPQVLAVRVQTDRQRWLGRNRDASQPLAAFDAARRRPPMRRRAGHRPRPGLRAVGAAAHRAQRQGPADLRHRGVRQRRHLARVIDKYRQPSPFSARR